MKISKYSQDVQELQQSLRNIESEWSKMHKRVLKFEKNLRELRQEIDDQITRWSYFDASLNVMSINLRKWICKDKVNRRRK